MRKVLVAYTTYDGHTAKIGERIGSALRDADCAVELCDLARTRSQRSLANHDGVIVGGPLHGGKHSRQLVRFVSENRLALNQQTSAFFSVSLSAAGNAEQQGDEPRCLNELLARSCRGING